MLRWPERVVLLGRQLAASPERSDVRGELWMLLAGALLQAIRASAVVGRRESSEDQRDLAAQKSFEMMRMFDCGKWSPGESAPGQIVVLVRRVARNGLVDALRRASRRDLPLTEEHLDRPAPETECDPALGTDRREFADALVGCAGELRLAHRRIWLFRVFLDMPGRDIADHPDVQLTEAHVNIILKRCREQVRVCMAGKGFEPGDMPTGSFAALWSAFRAWSLHGPGAGT